MCPLFSPFLLFFSSLSSLSECLEQATSKLTNFYMACYAPGLSLIKRLRAIWKSFLVQHYLSGGMNLTIRGTFLQGCTFSNLANIRSLFLNHMSIFRTWHIYECRKRCTNPSVNDEQMALFWEERSNNQKYNCINIHLSLCNFRFLNKTLWERTFGRGCS